jgi:hypothetical protein
MRAARMAHPSIETDRELTRLHIVRRVAAGLGSGGGLDLAGSFIAIRAKCVRSRRLLGSRTLVVFVSTLFDRRGMLVARRLTPVLIPSAIPIRSVAAIEAVRTELAAHSTDTWLESSRRVHAAFWQRRRVRDLAIDQELDSRDLAESQPGLFDRRDLREVAVHERAIEQDAADRLVRQRLIEAASELTLEANSAAIVLWP